MSQTPKLSRRTFFRRTLLAGGAVLTVYANGRYRITMAATGAGPTTYKLRVLHTNDHHARIEPANVTLQSTPTTVTRNFGGVARRKTLIDQLKAGAAADENIMLLDAGDVFQGTLYFNQYNGLADLFFYNALGYEAMAIGNHEFDKGQQALVDFINGANFPILSANITTDPSSILATAKSATDIADGTTHKWGKRVIITKGPVANQKKVGIFGLTPPDTGVLSNAGAGVTFGTDLVAIAQAQVDALKADGAEIIIGLTHVGYDQDKLIAAGVRGINLIVGGHSHTPLLPTTNPPSPVGVSTAGPYPTIVNDPDGKQVVITTDWEWAKWLGDITVGFDATNAISEVSGVIRPVWADGLGTTPRTLLPGEQPEIPADPTFQAKIDTDYKPGVVALQTKKVGSAAVLLDGERPNVRTKETNLGNLICDITLARTKTDGAQIAIQNGGGIRASIKAGDVTLGDVINVSPFGNTIALVTLTGAQVLTALENGVSQVNLANPSSSAGRFPQVGGLRFTWTPNRPAGSRILSCEVGTPTTTAAGAQGPMAFSPIDPTASYVVVTNNFLLTGGDGYSVFTQGTKKIDTGYILSDTIADYFTAAAGPVNAAVEGRIALRYRTAFPWITLNTTPTVTSTITIATELVRW
jgi:5'-nucleotidase